jgi:hypothetical protein
MQITCTSFVILNHLMKKLSLGMVLVLACSFSGTAHAQNLVTNGNFASPALGGGYSDAAPGNTTDITDWTVDAGGPLMGDPNNYVQIIGSNFSNNSGFGTFPGGSGAQAVQLSLGNDGDGAISNAGGLHQLIATTTGDYYTLTVDISARNGGGTATGSLYFGNPDGTGVREALSATTEAFVTSTTLTFQATSATTLIDITGTNNPSLSAKLLVIGNVVAMEEVVPEPSTYLLMGLGLFGLVVLRRFRRSNA